MAICAYEFDKDGNEICGQRWGHTEYDPPIPHIPWGLGNWFWQGVEYQRQKDMRNGVTPAD
jgi:hypothetical protein